jgi:hypothetical protein
MRRDLVRRLERIESRWANVSRRVVCCWVHDRIEDARRNALADNERIVRDLYRVDGSFGLARERITTDPADEGRSCLPGGYLEDVIRELHEVCDLRDHGCRTCHGLEHLFAQPRSENL